MSSKQMRNPRPLEAGLAEAIRILHARYGQDTWKVLAAERAAAAEARQSRVPRVGTSRKALPGTT